MPSHCKPARYTKGQMLWQNRDRLEGRGVRIRVSVLDFARYDGTIIPYPYISDGIFQPPSDQVLHAVASNLLRDNILPAVN